jgi:hypothetical protein
MAGFLSWLYVNLRWTCLSSKLSVCAELKIFPTPLREVENNPSDPCAKRKNNCLKTPCAMIRHDYGTAPAGRGTKSGWPLVEASSLMGVDAVSNSLNGGARNYSVRSPAHTVVATKSVHAMWPPKPSVLRRLSCTAFSMQTEYRSTRRSVCTTDLTPARLYASACLGNVRGSRTPGGSIVRVRELLYCALSVLWARLGSLHAGLHCSIHSSIHSFTIAVVGRQEPHRPGHVV